MGGCNATAFVCTRSSQTDIYTDLVPSLVLLGLSGNKITDIPVGRLQRYPGLQSLALDQNLITRLVTGVFDGLSRLQTLNLHTNPLTLMDARVLEPLVSLVTLDLGETTMLTYPLGIFSSLLLLEVLDVGTSPTLQSFSPALFLPDGEPAAAIEGAAYQPRHTRLRQVNVRLLPKCAADLQQYRWTVIWPNLTHLYVAPAKPSHIAPPVL